MRTSFSELVLGVALALMVGWTLHVGRGIIVPFVTATLVVYVIIGLARLLGYVPVIGPILPAWTRHLCAILVIAASLAAAVSLLITNVNKVAAVAPRYESRLLALIQQLAKLMGVDTEPTWTTLRDEVLNRLDLGTVVGSTVASVSQIVGVATLVFVYSGFLLMERTSFGAKMARLSRDPETVAGIHAVVAEINSRIGRYLAIKTFVNLVLGLISWLVMTLVGVEFAGFWALLIGLLNYIPYVGSFLGVLFPVALSALQFADLGAVLLVLLVLTAAQMFVGGVLEPYVMGNSLNLSPTVILFTLAVWSSLWGIPGAILSVPVTASILIVLSSFDATRPVAVLLSRDGRVADPVATRPGALS